MAEASEALKLRIQAINDTKSGLSGAGQALRKFQLDQRKSGEKALESLLKGGLIGGVTAVAGEQLAASMEAVNKLNSAFHKGEITIVERNAEILKSIPILGIGARIADAMGHYTETEKANREFINQQIERGNELVREGIERSTRWQTEELSHAHQMQAMRERTALVGVFGAAAERGAATAKLHADQNAEDEKHTAKMLSFNTAREKAMAGVQSWSKTEVHDKAGLDLAERENKRQRGEASNGGDLTEEEKLRFTTRAQSIADARDKLIAVSMEEDKAAKDHAENMTAIDAEGKANQEKITEESNIRKGELRMQADVLDEKIQESAQQRQLKNQGRFHEAEIAAIVAAGKHKNEEIEAQYNREMKAHPENTWLLFGRKNREQALNKESVTDQLIQSQQQQMRSNLTGGTATGGVTGHLTGAGMESRERAMGMTQRAMMIVKLDGILSALTRSPVLTSLLGSLGGDYGGSN